MHSGAAAAASGSCLQATRPAARSRSASARAAAPGAAAGRCSCAARDRARRGDEAAGAAGREGRARGPRRGRPARRCPGSRNGVRGISSRSAGEVLGRGGADDGADVVQRRCRAPAAPRPSTMPRDALPHALAALGSARSSTSAAPGFEVRTRTKTPASRRARGLEQRLERVDAEQRVGGEGVGAEARDRRRTASASRRPAPARRRRRRRRCRRACRRRARAGRPRGRARRPRCERGPAGRAEALEARELRLDGDARGPRRVDQRAGSAPRPPRRRARRAARRRAPSAAACGHRRAGSGSSPRTIWDSRPATSAASRSAKCGRRGASAAPASRRAAASSGRQPLTAFLSPEPAVKRGTLDAAIWIGSPVRGLHALTRAALGDVELAEARRTSTSLAARQRLLDGVEHGVNGLAGFGLAAGRRGWRPGRRTLTSSRWYSSSMRFVVG